MELRRIKENIFSSIVFMALSLTLYLFVIPWGVPVRASWGGDVGVDSRTFPYFSAIAMGLIAFGLLLSSLYQYAKAKRVASSKTGSSSDERHTVKEEFFGVVTFGLFVVYGLLLSTVGFVIASLVVPPVILLFLGERKIWRFIAVYGFASVLFVIFEILLKVQLP